MNELIVSLSYDKKELLSSLKISQRSWERNKDYILKFLKNFYEIDVSQDPTDKRKTLYTIVQQKQDFPGYTKSIAKRYERTIFLKEKILKILYENNLQTGSNLARLMYDEVSQEYDITIDTLAKEIRIILRDMFGKYKENDGIDGYIEVKLWCLLDKQKNRYTPLTPE